MEESEGSNVRLEKQLWKLRFFEGRAKRLANGLDMGCKTEESRITTRCLAEQLEYTIC